MLKLYTTERLADLLANAPKEELMQRRERLNVFIEQSTNALLKVEARRVIERIGATLVSRHRGSLH